MLQKLLAQCAIVFSAMFCTMAWAAVEVNTATQAQLTGIKGIGPATAARIVEERTRAGEFKDWKDLISRVKGIGDTSAQKFSKEGLKVKGLSISGESEKPAPKAADKPAAAKSAQSASAAAPDAKSAAAEDAARKKGK